MMTQTRNRARSPGRSCCANLAGLLAPKLFKALCDPNRLGILARLAEACAPCTVSQIAECCPVNLSVVSRHLAQLREAGVLQAEKRGKEVYYTVRFGELAQTLRAIADAIEQCCGAQRQSGGAAVATSAAGKKGVS